MEARTSARTDAVSRARRASGATPSRTTRYRFGPPVGTAEHALIAPQVALELYFNQEDPPFAATCMTAMTWCRSFDGSYRREVIGGIIASYSRRWSPSAPAWLRSLW